MNTKPRMLLGFTYVEAIAILIATVILIGLSIYARSADAASSYPSVAQLQAALNAQPGARLPPQVPQIIANGHVWIGYYIGTKDNGHGRYTVTLELRASR